MQQLIDDLTKLVNKLGFNVSSLEIETIAGTPRDINDDNWDGEYSDIDSLKNVKTGNYSGLILNGQGEICLTVGIAVIDDMFMYQLNYSLEN